MLPHHRSVDVRFERQKSWLVLSRSLSKSTNINTSGFSPDRTWQRSPFLSNMRINSAHNYCFQEQQSTHLREKKKCMKDNFLRRPKSCTSNLSSSSQSSPLISLEDAPKLGNNDNAKDFSAFPASEKEPWHFMKMRQKKKYRKIVQSTDEEVSDNCLIVSKRPIPPWSIAITTTTTTATTANLAVTAAAGNVISHNTNSNNTNWNNIDSTKSSIHFEGLIDNVSKGVSSNLYCIPSVIDRGTKIKQTLQSSVPPTIFQKVPPLSGKSFLASSCNLIGNQQTIMENFFQDPMHDAPEVFLQRVYEISSHQTDTVRFEKMRRQKKKHKPD
ncbi:uncharacterized protein LOC115218611 isoform X1 [Argonauta hians]